MAGRNKKYTISFLNFHSSHYIQQPSSDQIFHEKSSPQLKLVLYKYGFCGAVGDDEGLLHNEINALQKYVSQEFFTFTTYK